MLKFVTMIFLYSSLPSLSNLTKNNEKEENENTKIKASPYFYLSPYFPCSVNEDVLFHNKSKRKWLIEYKLSTTMIGGKGSHLSSSSSDIYILIFAQQMSVIRPRILELSFDNYNIKDKDKKLIKLYYQNDKKPQINPILLSVQNNTFLNLDKSIDINYENIHNENETNSQKMQKYKEMKKPKIQFTIVIDKIHQYIVKIYLTTNSNHFAHLKWTPRLF